MERIAWRSSMKFKQVVLLRRALSQKREGYSWLSDTALGDLFSDNVCLSEMGESPFDGRFCPCLPFSPLDDLGPQRSSAGTAPRAGARVVGESPSRYDFLSESAATGQSHPRRALQPRTLESETSALLEGVSYGAADS
jgi:hypothetical protein